MTILDPAPALPAVAETAPAASPTPLQLRASAAAFVRSGGSPLAHDHGTRCYWDFRDCRWVCAPV